MNICNLLNSRLLFMGPRRTLKQLFIDLKSNEAVEKAR